MKTIHKTTRFALALCAVLLICVLFLPIWRIELNAPQYPEGLQLLIYANGLRGNVDIINGLNHYIGMHTLHNADFIEFTLLPYLVVIYAVLFVVIAVLGKKKWLYAGLALFLLFGIVAMVDFWRWEYNYGHNLDPNAAIIVPGMAYQPPLIGFKQLLNFGAYSIPDFGGWLFIGAGVILLGFTIFEAKRRLPVSVSKKVAVPLVLLLMVSLSSCERKAQPLKVGTDACYGCKMTITDARYGAELLTPKGKVYKFDDIHCLQQFLKENSLDGKTAGDIYFADFSGNHALVKANESFLLQSEELRAPMNGKLIAFGNRDSMQKMAGELNGEPVNWENLSK